MALFETRPVSVDAEYFDGRYAQAMKLAAWIRSGGTEAHPMGDARGWNICIGPDGDQVIVRRDDWIVRGLGNRFYPVDPGIFHATYRPVEDGHDATAVAD